MRDPVDTCREHMGDVVVYSVWKPRERKLHSCTDGQCPKWERKG
jgi:hypothetical protein